MVLMNIRRRKRAYEEKERSGGSGDANYDEDVSVWEVMRVEYPMGCLLI